MIISDLNLLQAVDGAGVVGGKIFDYAAKIKIKTRIKSDVELTPFSSSATSDAEAAAAPFYIDGASTTATKIVVLAGRPAGDVPGASYIVGSYSGASGVAATVR